MKTASTGRRICEALSVLGALAIGPLFQAFGYWAGLVFAVAGAFYFFVCAAVVPLLTYAGGRLKFIVWQLALLSLVLSAIGDSLWARMFDGGTFPVTGTLREGYGLWLIGVLLSSPLPVYFILQPMPRSRRYIAAVALVAVVLALLLVAALVVR